MDRDRWLTERNRIPGIGASQSAALFGLHPYESAFSLFEKLVNPRDPTSEEQEEMRDEQEYGLAIEGPLARWYARKTQRAVEEPQAPGVYRLKDKPYLFCSPDRFIPNGVLQLKSGMHFNPSEPLPDYWLIQEQHEMLVTGQSHASFAIWGTFRKRYFVNDIPRNEAFGQILIETIERFMAAVQAGSWDRWGEDIDGSRSTAAALKRLYPEDNGTVVELPAEASAWAAELACIEAAAEQPEVRETQLKNWLRAAIGEHSYGVLEDGSGFSLKITKGSTYTVTKEDYRTLRRVKALPKALLRTVQPRKEIR